MTVAAVRSRDRTVSYRDGVLVYAREIFEVKGVPISPAPSADEVIAAARAITDSPVPAQDAPQNGLPQTAYTVEGKGRSAGQHRITVTWGDRSGSASGLTTRSTRSFVSRGQAIQPYLVVKDGGDFSILEDRQRVIPRGEVRIFKGGYLPSGSLQVDTVSQIAADNYGKLYTLNGQLALFEGLQIERRRNNLNWVWFEYRTTAWVREVEADKLEDGQLPIAGLPPLWAYGIPNGSEGTPALDPADFYDEGSVLPSTI